MRRMTQTRTLRRLAAPLLIAGTLFAAQAGAEIPLPEWTRPTDGAVQRIVVERPCHSGVRLYFEAGSAALNHAGMAALDLLAPTIIDHVANGRRVEIAGHGDMRPHEGESFALSGQRALAVVMYLVETWGVSPEYLDLQAMGARDLATLVSQESAKNRRVEVQLTGLGTWFECVIPPPNRSIHYHNVLEDWTLDIDDFGGGKVPLSLR
jgi:outer membrane protein OmpA-like peptidoglycan-associated protein